VSTYPDHILRVGSQQLAELKRKAAEFERQLWDAHESLEHEIEQTVLVGDGPAGAYLAEAPAEAYSAETPVEAYVDDTPVDAYVADSPVDGQQQSFQWTAEQETSRDPGSQTQLDVARPPEDLDSDGASRSRSPEERTARLIDHGRRRPKPTHRGRKIVLIGLAAAVGAVLLTLLILDLFKPGPSWPASVATVQRQIAVACRNPDIRSEPSQVNFACGRSTRQILWVFSLMTSGNNPNFASIRTGRQGLEPIKPAVGGQVAWSLNLHHPYSPANPIDSLQVAARAINNIIGGATMTAADGKPVVQPGLESVPANCARYTGSAAVTSRDGYPPLCAKPITSTAGQGYLVADVFRKWMVGARPSAAQDAAVLFQNVDDPGDPQVLAILKSLTHSRPSG
jgi:hypothetical protein